MKGYYNKPEVTAETIKDGWLHTGDIGTFVDGRFLKITDRKKEIFKTSGGKYIAPQVIENILKESIVIEQVMVVGDGQKFPGALIVPNFDSLQDYCKIKNIDYTTNEEMITKAVIIDKFQREIDKANINFARFETIKRFELLPATWTIESGELTPTLKCKRKVIHKKYEVSIEKIYDC